MRLTLIGLVLVLLLVSGCATIHTWDGGYPKDASQLSDAEKRWEFSRFAITSIERNSGRVVVKLADEPDKLYSFESFSPVISKISPFSERYMREAADYALYSSISSVAGTAAVFITPIVISVSSSGSSAIITTVVGSSVLVASLLANQVFDYLEKASYQSLLKEYLKDLNDHIFSSSKTSSIYHQLDYKVRSLAEANRQVIW